MTDDYTAAEKRACASPHLGKDCIIRTTNAGVHFGELVSQVGPNVELRNARRIWRFDVAPEGISLSDVAIHGSPGVRSRICAEVPAITLTDAIEIIPVSAKAAMQLRSAPVAKP